MILHCPLASDENVYKIMRFRSFPIAMGKDVFARIHTPKTLIAVGAVDRTGDQQFVEFDDIELGLCNRINNLYVCPHQQVISRYTQPSCLYNLYKNYKTEAVRDCQLKLASQADDTIMAIGKNRFISYAKEEIRYNIYCQGNGTRSEGHVLLAGYQEFDVSDGCVAELPHYIAQPINELFSKFERTDFTRSREWELEAFDLLPDGVTKDNIADAFGELDKLPTVSEYGNFFVC